MFRNKNFWKLAQWKYVGNMFDISLFIPDSQSFKCPAKDGQYEDSRQCDKFYQCIDGVAHEKLCPDGLVFDPTIRKINKCDQPFNVDCGDRLELRKYYSSSPSDHGLSG